ncbi:MAG TPA: hypothetical protein VJS38_07270 [Phenylobacterium sp.]|uniref:hypothetical protein n=1 Tax=Phenylobacterium sp. TaxID=1871053 RepID=UPI002B4A6E69|nr:hypothetical protein [Phenylobacterium sp.]HKR87961.1 hypothetical protein [Phenylobacterium sp.]HKT54929.1 hypothetical protein [Caulobacteraceae bacterium]
MIHATAGQRDLFNGPYYGLLAVSSDYGVLIEPDLHVVAAWMFVEKLARLRQGCRVVWQIDNLQSDGGFIEPAEMEGVHRHLTVSRNMAMSYSIELGRSRKRRRSSSLTGSSKCRPSGAPGTWSGAPAVI